MHSVLNVDASYYTLVSTGKATGVRFWTLYRGLDPLQKDVQIQERRSRDPPLHPKILPFIWHLEVSLSIKYNSSTRLIYISPWEMMSLHLQANTTNIYNTIQYNTIQYYTIQYKTILYNTIQDKYLFRLGK